MVILQTIGWIGTGQMGELMAMNLLQAGNRLHVYNRTIEKTNSLVEAGAIRASSAKEIVERCDVSFIMLSDTNAVKDVLTQEDGILAGTAPGKIIVDMSTISPEDSRAFAQLVSETGGIYLDAPVSGSVGPAKAGQLVILVGGEASAKEVCQPYFDVLGKETIHFGENGKGSAAKLSINLLLAIVGQGVGETVLLAEKAGLERGKVLEMISQSAMNTPLFAGKREMYETEEFPAAFMLKLMAKDLGLIKEQADRLEVDLPLAEAAKNTYMAARECGEGDSDMAAVYLELKRKNTK
ncbi:NAD(P)-dependent oxidoreductase [Pradoshia sp.]